MKAEYVNAFLDPAKLVWRKELSDELEFVSAEMVEHQFTTEDITSLIGVSGELEGNILYGLNRQTGLAIASRMIGEPVDEMDEMALSAIGEIANVISGNAATNLAASGYTCDITPPVMIENAGSRLTTLSGKQILACFTSSVGDIHIRISLNENGKRRIN